jgi:predicted RND superfamily exporter protein
VQRLNASTIEAIQTTMNNIGYSITLSSMAFVIGMLVLVLATVKSIVWFGLLIACGMFFAFLADMMLLPAILILTDKRQLKGVHEQEV